MECSSCGALLKRRSTECPECGAIETPEIAKPSDKSQPTPKVNPTVTQSEAVVPVIQSPPSPPVIQSQPAAKVMQPQPTPTVITHEKTPGKSKRKARAKPTSSLIEFPRIAKTSSIPQWRKELGERVREVQERRLREAALELSNASREIESEPKTASQLELLPQSQTPPLNPLVVAALQRIERAHVASHFGVNATAMAVAFEEQPEFGEDMSQMANETTSAISQPDKPAQPERVHNLAVVPNSVVGKPETSDVIRKPKRLIAGDLNDPALNYLDSIPTLHVEKREYRSASVPFRVISAIVDLIVICLISSPLVVVVELLNLNWQDWRVITSAAGTFIIVGFLYLTITTALTGRTLGMKLSFLRVVDSRTGLIPTGAQSAGRAAIYLLSIVFAGIALIYTFFNDKRHTPHDRFTRTAVIRV